MRLVGFSTSKYRSIINAHRLPLDSVTILVGRNNEGKSNILNGLATAMTLVSKYAAASPADKQLRMRAVPKEIYDWERDYPISLQASQPNGVSSFRVELELTDEEIDEFRDEIRSNLNGTLPIEITIGQKGDPAFKVKKQGLGGKTLSGKAQQIAAFVGRKLDFSYIPAIRTEASALSVVYRMVQRELVALESDAKYQAALMQIANLQDPVLKKISKNITVTLKQFIPDVKSVNVQISSGARLRGVRTECEIIVDDGEPTALARKGDGVKSLAAISLLRETSKNRPFSVLALEEPESHLHPEAIHNLRDVILELAKDTQVVLTTHNPLFVDRVNIANNIIVQSNQASPAKDVKDIRTILGVRASDNLMHARLVLLVEGDEDRRVLGAIFKSEKPALAKALSSGAFVIEPIGGAGNLGYKLGLVQQALCMTHVFADDDEAGRIAITRAEDSGLLRTADYNISACKGMKDAELEDCLDVAVYEDAIQSEFNVSLASVTFRNNGKWSDRMRDTFKGQGKVWNERMEGRVKAKVAEAVEKSPALALNAHKRGAVDALAKAIEDKLVYAGKPKQ